MQSNLAFIARRQALWQGGWGLGAIALASLASPCPVPAAPIENSEPSGSKASGTARATHFRPRVRRVIQLFMHGGPSHVDLFDPKPELERLAGKPLPESFGPVTTRRKVAENPLLPAVRPFARCGESGLEISQLFPHLACCADDLCVLRSCHGDSVNHPQSVYQMNTGSILMGRPSVGSWVAYGLGCDSQDLPAYVVLPDPGGGTKGGPPAWGNGYLPAAFQGTAMRPGARPVLDLTPPSAVDVPAQTRSLDLLRRWNERHRAARDGDDELAARMESYELAFRMQAAAPEVFDLSRETAETRRHYGLEAPETREFGERCLLARRLVEQGVRFVQLYSGDTNGWDAHANVAQNHGPLCLRTDLPIAALLTDLRRRGLWDDTLVVWGGEFGRMPMSEQGQGRDHNPWGYTVWLAGGGVRGGMAYGATDAVGLRAVDKPVHVHDLHATLLHLLGLDHERLTYFHNGREQRLTEVAGHVVREILA